jgi:hypothetical protein
MLAANPASVHSAGAFLDRGVVAAGERLQKDFRSADLRTIDA